MVLHSILRRSSVIRFLKDERGATAIEYGLMTALIGVAISATVMGLGSRLNTMFSSISGTLANMGK